MKPPCCVPSEGATLAERLYCAYQAGGPSDRAGLAWDGRPCPTWRELNERACSCEPGAEAAGAVLQKWHAVARLASPVPA